MADSPIISLPTAGALAGTEALPIVQSSTTKKTTVQDIVDLASGSNLGSADLTSTSNTRKFTLNGSLASNTLVVEAASGSDIVQFRGDNSVHIPNGRIGLGTTPSSSIKLFTGSNGESYGHYVTGSFGAAAYTANTPNVRGFYVRRLPANSIGFSAESIISSGSNTMFEGSVASTGTANTTVFKLRAPISGAYTPDTLIAADIEFINAAQRNIGVVIDCDNGVVENTAIHIKNGDIKLPSGNVGFTGTGAYTTLTIENGIITNAV